VLVKEASLALIMNGVGDLLASTHKDAGWSLPGGKAEEGEVDPKQVLRRVLPDGTLHFRPTRFDAVHGFARGILAT
jgi:ADP-ribose pyrophosphatase YjhB (NUDIX family)